MVTLRAHSFGGRFGQGGMGLEGFMEDFDFPSFLIDRLKGVCVQVEVTTGPIQCARTVVFVCKDLPMEEDGKI